MRSCFVVMPIGDMRIGDKVLGTAQDFRERYTHLIKEAVLRADPGLGVTRADDIAAPGAITKEIFSRIMDSDIVIADVSFPNPNVFYELGLRHACRPGTILLRDRAVDFAAPFDIASLRHISYENTPAGLERLAQELASQLAWIEANEGAPDSEFMVQAKLAGFQYPAFADPTPDQSMQNAFIRMVTDPDVLRLVFQAQREGRDLEPEELLPALTRDPEALSQLLQAMFASGQLRLDAGEPHGR